jgi:exopolysaccharide biosynthesis protein
VPREHGVLELRFTSLALTCALGLIVTNAAPAGAAITAPYAPLGSQTVTPGVTRGWGTVTAASGRQVVNIVEVDTSRPGIHLRTSLAADRVTARERTTHQALTYSREERRVVATINGSTFGSWPMGHVAARGLNVQNGELLTAGRIAGSQGPMLGFGIDGAGRPVIGAPSLDMEVTMPDGTVGRVDRVNQGRLSDESVIYTPRFDTHTWTDTYGDEYVIEGLDLPLRPHGTHSGTVVEVRRGLGGSQIGAGQIVLSATGARAEAFSGLTVGDEVGIQLTMEQGWRDIVHAVGGRELIVRNGEMDILPYREAQMTEAHPRSAVGITRAGKIILVTVDGRSSDSGGLTLPELSELMIELDAVSALNLDGGGSTTLAVRRPGDIEVGIVNTPSQGVERTVATAIQVVSTIPTGALDTLLLSPKSSTIYVGQTQQYVVKGHDAAYNGIAIDPSKVNWEISGSPATANASGELTATTPGEHAVIARTQGVGDTAQLTVLVDGTVPTVTAPLVQLRRGVGIPKTSAKVAVSWTGSDDSGLSRVELQRRVDGGTWQSITLGSRTATSANTKIGFGKSVEFRVRATDTAGNRSAWMLSRRMRVTLHNERGTGVVRSGSWAQKSSTSAIGGQFARSTTVGAAARITFQGAQAAWIGLRGPKHGQGDVYLGGTFVERVLLRSSTTLVGQVLYVTPLADVYATLPTRTLEVRNAGTSTRPRVDLDAFLVLEPAP